MGEQEYYIQKFKEFAGRAKYKKSSNSLYGSCNICKEGSSWMKKFRLYYLLDKDIIYCHNCGYSKKPINYVMDSCGMSKEDIKKEIEEGGYADTIDLSDEKIVFKQVIEPLPKDSINLYDKSQLHYYKNNKIVRSALEFLVERRLYNSINRPKAFYVSLTDFIHKNRLIIPHFDMNNVEIDHYQSRSLFDNTDMDKNRYVSKNGSEKTVFNIPNVQWNNKYIYIFEGAFNSCFVKNGVAIAGITTSHNSIFSEKQMQQLRSFPFHKQVFILDNQWIDKTSYEKTKYLIETGKCVFIWPQGLDSLKDFNDIAIRSKLFKIEERFIHNNMYEGQKAINKFSEIEPLF